MLTIAYTLEFTQQALVSDIVCTFLLCSTLLCIQSVHVLQKSEIHVAPLCIVNKLDSLVLPGKLNKIICLENIVTVSLNFQTIPHGENNPLVGFGGILPHEIFELQSSSGLS